jgi:peptidoglycan/LPS O-acetylase OafA/YrhL
MKQQIAAKSKPFSFFNLGADWRGLFRRSEDHEPVIDGVRALAILWVLALHLALFHISVFPAKASALIHLPALKWIVNGLLGVDMFFVISGYLIGSILFREFKRSGGLVFSRFYVRRFLRLIPVYTAVMLLGLYFLRNPLAAGNWYNARNLWANLLYVNNLLPVSRQYMAWCWSLAIEEQFYLLLPAFLVLFMSRGRGRLSILIALMALSVGIRYAVLHFSGMNLPMRHSLYSRAWNRWFDLEYDKPWMRFGGLLAGVTGAYLSCYRAPQLRAFFARAWLTTTLAVGSLAVFVHLAFTDIGSPLFDRMPHVACALWFAVYHDVFSLAVLLLILTAIYAPSLLGRGLRSVLSWKAFYPVAQLSYSIYLTHEMILLWLFPRIGPWLGERFGPRRAMAMDCVIAVAIVFALSIALHLLIERPCMRLRSHPRVLGAIEFFSRKRELVAA